MSSTFDIFEYVEKIYLSDIRWLLYARQFIIIIKKHHIRTVYIAPKGNYSIYRSYINEIKGLINVEVVEFDGGFKENSIVLFPFYSKGDLEYFTQVTGLTP